MDTATQTRRERVFYCRMHGYTSMVGCVGEPKGSPVVSRYANPAQFTTR
ncbi:TPA: hypothetical protein R8E83_003557 [Escherichia coli]|nr:hypothetical protein [Escherichia coli]